MRENQIEEMCKIMRCVDDQSCANTPMCPESHDICDRVSCRQCKEARLLLDAGYRKQSDGEWIWDKEHSNYKCGLCGEYDITTPKFCRECGAKMKGGEG